MLTARVWLACIVLCSSLTGCAGLNLGALLGAQQGSGAAAMTPPPAPHVSVASVRLAESPSNEMLGAYYCARELSRRGVPSFVANATCQVFGRMPSRDQLRFAFEVQLDIENVARIPLPLMQALVAFHAFPDDGVPASLGAVCVSLCENPASCPATGADACRSTDPMIRDMDDFANAAVNFLIAVARGDRQITDLRVRTVPAGQTVRAVVRLELDVDQMLGLLERVFRQVIDSIANGRMPSFVIPYSIDGSVWVRVENFGRIGASFGPTRGTWDVSQTTR